MHPVAILKQQQKHTLARTHANTKRFILLNNMKTLFILVDSLGYKMKKARQRERERERMEWHGKKVQTQILTHTYTCLLACFASLEALQTQSRWSIIVFYFRWFNFSSVYSLFFLLLHFVRTLPLKSNVRRINEERKKNIPKIAGSAVIVIFFSSTLFASICAMLMNNDEGNKSIEIWTMPVSWS